MENKSSSIVIEQNNGNGDTTYLTHNFHTYPAKFIPQIPRSIIKSLSEENEIVLDPFCGCGTTLVEANLLGRNSIGVDLNPIATLVSKAKTTPLLDDQIKKIDPLLKRIEEELSEFYKNEKDINVILPEFNNRDHWFQKNVLYELAIIKSNIIKLKDKELQIFLFTAFSSIIVSVSNQESDTRFAAINKNIRPMKCFDDFSKKVQTMILRIKEFSKISKKTNTKIVTGDTRHMSFIPSNSVDLIVTSPPYANTYDYYLYHKFRMYWLDFDVKRVQNEEIGSRNRHSSKKEEINTFEDALLDCMNEIGRVLKNGKYAVIVIGDSVIRGKIHKANELMKKIAKKTNFVFEREISYNLKANSRMFNPKFTNGDKLEYIIFFKNQKG